MAWFSAAWHWYLTNASAINPIVTSVGAVGAFVSALALALAGLRNARTAARRHEEQTNADRLRRITESFSKAVEQLASEKIEVRLGGIYTLERISRESASDYWTVMETLTAFLRENRRWKEPDTVSAETLVSLYNDQKPKATQQPEPTTDIAAVLSVIVRRDDKNRDREKSNGWRLNFRGSDLRGADLVGAHLEGVNLHEAHLEEAGLTEAHLEGAGLEGAHLEGTDLIEAHLEGAFLSDAHLERADLREARLEGAFLRGAHLEGANLAGAEGIAPNQIAEAYGDSRTILPHWLTRPEHWASGS